MHVSDTDAPLPPAIIAVANDNNPLLYEGWTPIAALLACKKAQDELKEKHAQDGILLTDPRARRLMTLLGAFEACLRWHHFRE